MDRIAVYTGLVAHVVEQGGLDPDDITNVLGTGRRIADDLVLCKIHFDAATPEAVRSWGMAWATRAARKAA